MSRIACLLVPDVPLAAALRAEPELRGRKLAVVAYGQTGSGGQTGSDGQIVSGRMRGLTPAQARAIDPDLTTRRLSIEGMHSVQEALVDVALSVTPRVEDTRPGQVHLDLAGTRALFPSERGLATALETRLAGVGLDDTRIGIGPSATVAELAARHCDGGIIVSEGERESFLAPLPLDLLDPPDEIFDRLTRWGLHTLGELANLPQAALGARLGEEGVRLARRARGADLQPFRPTPPRLRFEESAETGHPVDNLEALAFPLRSVSDRLGRRLRVRGLAARELRLELTLESGRGFARNIGLGAPTTEARVITSLVRLALEADAPAEPVEALRLIATPGQLETAQLDLFLPPLPAPAELAITVARLEALCGTGRVGAPGVEDTHRPDAARLEPFETSRPSESGPEPEPSVPAPAMALRAFRPAQRVRVRVHDGLPQRVDGLSSAAIQGALVVSQRAGPWRLFGEWWGERCFARDYFDVELSDRGVYRMYHNLQDDSWYVDGIYD
ncbi:MAG: DNA polymerase Y family protein [Deltaproteobacteria bacterium]|nr:DNA polymerase Y family protein [Deltaproteobacteria bacterium]MBW2413724.1 DNA polymerase Y family protein [Deltaproteobacteria bacterium]